MTLAEGVSLRLRELMEEREMTAYKLFKMSGVAQATISNLLNKKINNVTLRTIIELSEGLGVELSAFFDTPYLSIENITD